MAIQRRTAGSGVTVLQIDGEYFGGDETDRLRDAIRAEAASGNTRLLLDLSGCGRVNSNALSVMVEAHQSYLARRGEIKLCGVQKHMMSYLVMTRLIDVFSHYPTEAEALAAFGPGSVPA
jgi:anti-anti-sigma factor